MVETGRSFGSAKKVEKFRPGSQGLHWSWAGIPALGGSELLGAGGLGTPATADWLVAGMDSPRTDYVSQNGGMR